jgi:hypothetical protein
VARLLGEFVVRLLGEFVVRLLGELRAREGGGCTVATAAPVPL